MEEVNVMAGAIFAVVGLIISSVFFAIDGVPWADYQLNSGTKVEAVVENVVFDLSSSINKVHPWEVTYNFETPDGQKINGVGRTFKEVIAQMAHQSGKIAIEYLPNSPKINRIVGEKRAFFGLYGLLPNFVLIVGIVVLITGIKKK